jgi:acyl carrier protein
LAQNVEGWEMGRFHHLLNRDQTSEESASAGRSIIVLTRHQIIECIYAAVDEVNDRLPAEAKLQKAPETRLFGRESSLDSLGLVNLVVAAEENLEQKFGVSVRLTDERAMSQRRSPFRSVETLASYIEDLLEA